jgi:hypothetical protein
LDLLHIKSTTDDARGVLDGASGFDAELKFFEDGAAKYTIGHDAASGNFVIGTTNVDTGQKIVIDGGGDVGIGTTTPGSYRLNVTGGDAYFSGDVSAASFTDRTPYPENIGIAYDAVMSMKRLPEGEYDPDNKESQLDHSTLTDFVKGDDGYRDLSATVSAQNEVIKDLIRRIGELEYQMSNIKCQNYSQ